MLLSALACLPRLPLPPLSGVCCVIRPSKCPRVHWWSLPNNGPDRQVPLPLALTAPTGCTLSVMCNLCNSGFQENHHNEFVFGLWACHMLLRCTIFCIKSIILTLKQMYFFISIFLFHILHVFFSVSGFRIGLLST